MPKVPFKFSEFAPDSEEYNNPSLEKLENGLPMYGGYRGVRQTNEVAVTADDTEVATGAYAHLLSSDFDVQHGKVNADTAEGEWRNSDYEGSANEIYSYINETAVDDTTFISNMDFANNPTLSECRLELPDLNDPGTPNSHTVGLRYRGWIDEGTGSLYADIYDGNTKVEDTQNAPDHHIIDVDITTSTGEWQYTEAVLTPADVTANLSDYTDLNLRISGEISGMTGANSLLVIKPDEDVDNSDNWINENDEPDNLYASINDVIKDPADGGAVDENTFIETPILSDDETSSYIAGFDRQSRPMKIWYRSGFVPESADIKVHAKVADKDATTMSIAIGEDDSDTYTEVLADHSFTASGTYEEVSETITGLEMSGFDPENWRTKISFTHTGGVGSTQQLDPASDVSMTSGMTWSAAGTSDYNNLKDSSDLTYFQTPQDILEYTYKGTIASSPKPETISSGDVRFVVTHRSRGTFGSPLRMRFRVFYGENNDQTFTWTKTLDDTYDEFRDWTINLNSNQANSLRWGDPFTYEITKVGTSDVRHVRGLRVSEVKMNTPGIVGVAVIAPTP